MTDTVTSPAQADADPSGDRTTAGDAGATEPLLSVRDLSVDYTSRHRPAVHAVTGVSLDIRPGEFVGLLGESGSGKSTLGNALLGLLERPAEVVGGSVTFAGEDLLTMPPERLRRLRWSELSTVFQSSMDSLNPVRDIRTQFSDTFADHRDGGRGLDDAAVEARTLELLRTVSLPDRVAGAYPHELSGGMKQRVSVALSLALRPRLVVLDEPTTGLDVVVQRAIVDKLRELQIELGFAVLFISHDLGTVMEAADRVLVMYAGELVEDAPAGVLLDGPRHPYSVGLLGSYADPRDPDLSISSIPGRPPDLSRAHEGCLFLPRCPVAIGPCASVHPQLLQIGDAGHARCLVSQGVEGPPEPDRPAREVFSPRTGMGADTDARTVLSVEGLHKTYVSRRGLRRTRTEAVVDVSFALRRGRVTALVGQSGSGKSTIAAVVTGVEKPTSGQVSLGDTDVNRLGRRALVRYRRSVQLVFQDPFTSLNPSSTVEYTLSRPLHNHRGLRGAQLREESASLLEMVGLSPAAQFLSKLPHELSGGQRQRVVIARALATRPEVLVADEPISMLDVSIRADILSLLDSLVRDRGISMLYITHDLLSARLLADDILVLQNGRVVESGRAADVVAHPRDDYTRTLLDAIPSPGSRH